MIFKIWLTLTFLIICLIGSIKIFGDVLVRRYIVDTVKILFPVMLCAEIIVTLLYIWQ
jgi:hypothetical protein